MKPLLPIVMTVSSVALLPVTVLAGNSETEPNDSKAQANVFQLPLNSTPALITGNSTSAAGAGLDYFRLHYTQPLGTVYRHRLIIQSVTPGHTATLRGLSQSSGTIDPTSDIDFQVSSDATVPPRFVQWYTLNIFNEIYVRIAGTEATTADYSLDYEVQFAPFINDLPPLMEGTITISTVGQTTEDTDLWMYSDKFNFAIPDYGNDDEFNGSTLQSTLTRSYFGPQVYSVAISTYNMGNDLASPVDDDFRDGNVLDFDGALANNDPNTNQDLDLVFTDGGGPHPLSATKVGPFDIVFVHMSVTVPVELIEFQVE